MPLQCTENARTQSNNMHFTKKTYKQKDTHNTPREGCLGEEREGVGIRGSANAKNGWQSQVLLTRSLDGTPSPSRGLKGRSETVQFKGKREKERAAGPVESVAAGEGVMVNGAPTEVSGKFHCHVQSVLHLLTPSRAWVWRSSGRRAGPTAGPGVGWGGEREGRGGEAPERPQALLPACGAQETRESTAQGLEPLTLKIRGLILHWVRRRSWKGTGRLVPGWEYGHSEGLSSAGRTGRENWKIRTGWGGGGGSDIETLMDSG